MLGHIKFFSLLIIFSYFSSTAKSNEINTLPPVTKWLLNVNGDTDTMILTTGRQHISSDGYEKSSYYIEWGKNKRKGKLYISGNTSKLTRSVTMKLALKDNSTFICKGGLFDKSALSSNSNLFMAGSCGEKRDLGTWHAVKIPVAGKADTGKFSPVINDKNIVRTVEPIIAYQNLNNITVRGTLKNNECNKPTLKDQNELRKFLVSRDDGKFDQTETREFPKSGQLRNWVVRRNNELKDILKIGLGVEYSNGINSGIKDKCEEGNIYCEVSIRTNLIYHFLNGDLND